MEPERYHLASVRRNSTEGNIVQDAEPQCSDGLLQQFELNEPCIDYLPPMGVKKDGELEVAPRPFRASNRTRTQRGVEHTCALDQLRGIFDGDRPVTAPRRSRLVWRGTGRCHIW